MKAIAVWLATGLMLAVAPIASAQEPEIEVTAGKLKLGWERVSGEVPYGDLNLAREEGRTKLRQRVLNEAERLCGLPGGASVVEQQNRRACFQGMMRSAEPQLLDVLARARAGG